MEIRTTNVNRALSEGLRWLIAAGTRESSRNGPVLVSPEPVMTVYSHPTERVLFSPLRDANPFFHLMEALWMLAGRDDVAWPVRFNSKFAAFSDDGESFHGAYGYRWRYCFGFDQLNMLVNELRRNPETRRAVLTMWDATWPEKANGWEGMGDLHKAVEGGKDVPCNTHAYLDCREGALNMTVLCRSNDIWWGAYGANAVHFSILQEYLAAAVGVPVGVYRQFSNNFHLYTDIVPQGNLPALATDAKSHDLYAEGNASPMKLVSTPIEEWDAEVRRFVNGPELHPTYEWRDPFFRTVALPMYRAYMERKIKTPSGGQTGMFWAENIVAPDWRKACTNWIRRRESRKMMEVG